MAEVSTLLKALRKVKPEVAADLEFQVDKNLLRSHPGLSDSSVMWYGGKMTNYLNEVTKNDSSQYAIAMMDADEISKLVGRANMEDPAVKSKVLDLYNRATLGDGGLQSIVKLDGLVNEKGFVDVTRVTPGSQETIEALRLLDRDRPPDLPMAKIPVLVQANGAKWGTDPAPRLRYNGQTTGTLSMPKWDARRPPPVTQTVADARSPSFYRDQPKNLEAAKAKLATIYDPAASLLQGEVLKKLQTVDPIEEFAFGIQHQKLPPQSYVKEAMDYTKLRRERMQEVLAPVIEQYGRDYIRQLAGKDNLLTQRLLGATDDTADDPIVLTRTERYGMVPFKEGEFSPALSNPRETAMHAGEPITARAFQGNNWYHDSQVAKQILKTAKPKTTEYIQAETAIRMHDRLVSDLKENMAEWAPQIPKGKLEALLFDAVKEAKEQFASHLKPGQRNSIAINRQGKAFLATAVENRLQSYGVKPAAVEKLAEKLADYVGLTEGTGTTTKHFVLRNVKRPLFLVDTGNFSPSNVLRQLQSMPEFEKQARQMLAKEHLLNTDEMGREIQRLIEGRGYDSAIYLNASSEGAVNKFANLNLENSRPQGFSPSYMIWKDDQIVPLDDPKLFPNRGDTQLKKALAVLLAAPAATKEKNDGTND